MITNDNFKELVKTLRPEEITKQIDKKHDYVLFEAHIFNTGGFATIKSCNYSEKKEKKAQDNGQLFCDKDTFLQLLEETQALEY